MSRTEHPGSSGGWASTFVEYDILGRVKRQSVPTETNSSYTPAGDDTAGPLWTHLKYDWMGRVIRKINTDGVDDPSPNDSDIFITYEGCGCAGGLVAKALDNTEDCRQYIVDLIKQAAKNANLDAKDIVSTDIEELFFKVYKSRGTYWGDSGGVFIGSSGNPHTARNAWNGRHGPPWAEIVLEWGSGNRDVFQIAGDPQRAMSAIHELIHVSLRSLNYADADTALAYAAADVAQVELPIWEPYDPTKPWTGESTQASRYWGERLNQACGFLSSRTGRPTSHQLYPRPQ